MHERSVVRVPADVPQATLAPFGCGIQTGVGAVSTSCGPAPAARSPSSAAGTTIKPVLAFENA